MEAQFFESASTLHQWFEKHHTREKELWVGIYKKESGKASVTWEEVKWEILCFGWAEGKIQPIDTQSYAVRLTPRKPKSMWSLTIIAKAKELIDTGLVYPLGIKAFEERDLKYEKKQRQEAQIQSLTPAYLQQLEANPEAWHYWEQEAPSYRKAAIRWVMRAKQEATQKRRLDSLIESSEAGLKIPPMRLSKKSS